VQHLTAAAARVSNDPEIEYYTGLALQLLDDDPGAAALNMRHCGFPGSRAPEPRAWTRGREAAALLDAVVRESPESVRRSSTSPLAIWADLADAHLDPSDGRRSIRRATAFATRRCFLGTLMPAFGRTSPPTPSD
jgi:hypothetical protein